MSPQLILKRATALGRAIDYSTLLCRAVLMPERYTACRFYQYTP
jgi:hypothetical protein